MIIETKYSPGDIILLGEKQARIVAGVTVWLGADNSSTTYEVEFHDGTPKRIVHEEWIKGYFRETS